ncbi:MFS transporter [Microbacterium sp. 13-71-7]|jgi:EmrB/QacA subfamily drug resistance transporter|uniref:MFS transporter n=1 Tax=Microbacterium sp. 13-71-7 TaxID=1970399 RepID=UPI000BD683F7|nr:MFS transporter [Microbacterium sp. 13-71-7]OZB84741.1 MAG: MFS transporter [Microbacterium sp. 13-71-7]
MTIDRASVGFRSERGPVLLSLMLAMGLIAMDATILATAVPSVVRDLGSYQQFPWLFSIYLLAQAVSVPIYSKLADTVGRKPIVLIGIALFLLGSILCGLAWSMPSLILFRLLQGLGAGAVGPMVATIVGDIYTLSERAVVQGYIASVWALSSVVGPALGGVFAQFDAWRLIFFINIPLCLIAAWMLLRHFHEQIEKRRHRIDYAGAVLLTIALTAIIVGVLEGGNAWAWQSVPSLACFVGGGIALVAFGLVERRAAEPIIDLRLISGRLILTTTLASLAIGALLTGITSFAPAYLQGAIAVPPLLAGLAVAALTLGWPLSAANAGRLYLRHGFRFTALIGASIATLGAIGLALIGPYPSAYTLAAVAFVIGFGLGWTAAPTLIVAQASVGWGERGAVTGMNTFARSAGSAVGVAVFGAISNAVIASGGGSGDPATVVRASTWVFVAAAVTAVLMLLAILAMPKDRAGDHSGAPAPTPVEG